MSELIKLPCGGKGFFEETGVRCLDCLTIYGSIGCPCSRPKKKQKEEHKVNTKEEDIDCPF